MINFPTSIDSLSNPNAGDALNSPSHAGQHSDANDAIEALQAKVGADSSAVATSHDYKIATLETNNTGTNTGDQSASDFNHDDLSNITGTAGQYNHPTDAQMTVLGNTSGTNTGDVTLAGTPDYITITDQVITRNQIDLTADVTGDLPVAEGGTGASDAPTALSNLGGIGAATTDTLTNKTFDANGTGNSLSNVDVADLANGTDGELITWGADAAPTTVAAGTSGQVLTSNGAGAAPTFQDAQAVSSAVAGDILIASSDAAKAPAQQASLTIQKTISIGVIRGGEYRIKFTLSDGSSSFWVEAQIYRNGTPVGTLRQNKTGSPVEYSEDISGWSVNDDIEIYGRNVVGTGRTISNFRVYADTSEITTNTLD